MRVISKLSVLIGIFLSWSSSSGATQQGLRAAVTFDREMIVTPDPLATAAGEDVLKRGGSAADAMVTVQAVLGLVEPQSSGLGGGAFVVYHDASSGRTTTIDGREKAPASAAPDRFEGLNPFLAWQSGLSVGVPGAPRLMEFVHGKYGRLGWDEALFQSAIDLAEDGFTLSERTSGRVDRLFSFNPSCEQRLLFRDPTAFEYFAYPNCTAKTPGTVLRNGAYAETLRALARDGADAIYAGAIASDIVAAVQNDITMPGDMTEQDLADYDVVERPPVCPEYRGHAVCGMGPPSSGGLGVGQILGILESSSNSNSNSNSTGSGDGNPLDVGTVHLFTQAARLAFADRGLYVADSDFVTVPVDGMLDEEYLAGRAGLITDTDMGIASPGVPPGDFDPSSPDGRAKDTGTSHVSIVDRYGNALSMTTSIEAPFGNGVMVHGFLLNNQLTDFSSTSTDPATNLTVANRVEGNKRPRSSMAPTIVFDEQGLVKLVTGSTGGSTIIGNTAQAIMNMIDFGLDPQEAINVPHYNNRNGQTNIEAPIEKVTLDYNAEALALALKERGHSDPTIPIANRTVGIIAMTSGLASIQVSREDDVEARGALLIGGVDARRPGTVGGSDVQDDTAVPTNSLTESPTESPALSIAPSMRGIAASIVGVSVLAHMILMLR